uniref:WAP domain-containing protein n=1 Tax=Oryctolagus cuniculus TaxID=9986 RepID=A0A5F9DEY7_RABIT
MNLGGFLLLVTLVTLSVEVQELQAAVRPLQLFGTCVELCSGDWDCGVGESCVSNGCGHVCATSFSAGEIILLPQASFSPNRLYSWPQQLFQE